MMQVSNMMTPRGGELPGLTIPYSRDGDGETGVCIWVQGNMVRANQKKNETKRSHKKSKSGSG